MILKLKYFVVEGKIGTNFLFDTVKVMIIQIAIELKGRVFALISFYLNV